ncbi:MAG TPA: flagellin [Caulobacteraceae bacterium]
MSLNSVNTNVGAMIALENLNSTSTQLQKAQNQISTGLKVASAKDDGSTWAIAQNQRAQVLSLDSVKSSLSRGQSALDVAISAGGSVSDLLTQMKALALSASDQGLTTTDRSAINDQFKSLRDQITTIVSNADFNGTNLVKASGTNIYALANADGTSKITVLAEDMSLGGTDLTAAVTTTASIGTATIAGGMVGSLQTAIDNVSGSLAKLGTGSNALNTHMTFISSLQDSLNSGISNLVDADLAKESATLQALQTKQQLGVQALSIANSSSSVLLSLFR